MKVGMDRLIPACILLATLSISLSLSMALVSLEPEPYVIYEHVGPIPPTERIELSQIGEVSCRIKVRGMEIALSHPVVKELLNGSSYEVISIAVCYQGKGLNTPEKTNMTVAEAAAKGDALAQSWLRCSPESADKPYFRPKNNMTIAEAAAKGDPNAKSLLKLDQPGDLPFCCPLEYTGMTVAEAAAKGDQKAKMLLERDPEIGNRPLWKDVSVWDGITRVQIWLQPDHGKYEIVIEVDASTGEALWINKRYGVLNFEEVYTKPKG